MLAFKTSWSRVRERVKDGLPDGTGLSSAEHQEKKIRSDIYNASSTPLKIERFRDIRFSNIINYCCEALDVSLEEKTVILYKGTTCRVVCLAYDVIMCIRYFYLSSRDQENALKHQENALKHRKAVLYGLVVLPKTIQRVVVLMGIILFKAIKEIIASQYHDQGTTGYLSERREEFSERCDAYFQQFTRAVRSLSNNHRNLPLLPRRAIP